MGAIFISTLAITRLAEPHLPPHNQEERLAASLHPLVSFVVLGSIIVRELHICSLFKHLSRIRINYFSDGLSVPFLKIGHRTISLSSTWSKLTVKPDWLSSIRNGSSAQRPEDEIAIGEDGMNVALRSKSFSPAERTSTSLLKPNPVQSFESGPSIATFVPILPQFVPFIPISDGNSSPPSEPLPSESNTISNTVSRTDEHRE